jgi:ElaA protein
MPITFYQKTFNQLSLNQLYALAKLRADVFVLEQNCLYPDLDNKDQQALHILGYEDDELVAYARCFKPGLYFTEASIGRVLVAKNQRKKAFGQQLMHQAIKAIASHYSTSSIRISAQLYLLEFYTSLGFKKTGDSYLEDGIPHIKMLYYK